MEKKQITVKVAGEGARVIEAYQTPTDGLVVHRQLAWVPAKEEHKFTSKWQVTHAPTGLALLEPSECPRTMASALKIAEDVGDMDWAGDVDRGAARAEILSALSQVDDADEDPAAPREPSETRYVVRRNPDGPGYAVFDIQEDKVVEEITHRGLAAKKARDLNEGVST